MRPLLKPDRDRLDTIYENLRSRQTTYLGYPNSQLLDNGHLSRFLDLTLNNCGDPFAGNGMLNTMELERELIGFFTTMLHLDAEEGWGYVTNGGTESNLYGLFLARETYPDGVLFHSADTHYSVPKAARVLGMRSVVIPSLKSGEIDYDAFSRTVASLAHYPVILNANIGTTMKGAIDDLNELLSILKARGIERHHIHCDAALFGSMLPFVEGAPAFDFRLPIASLAISGHKFIGSPIPCGVALARRQPVQRMATNVEYIGSRDATLSGSRDGFSVLILWQAIRRLGYDGLASLVRECLQNRDYALERLETIDWPSWANPHSNIVVIRRPEPATVKKWQLAAERDLSHLVVMPGVSRERIDAFVADLKP